jgi:CheY-like chemotaxis protein
VVVCSNYKEQIMPTVLIVDDKDINRKVLVTIFRFFGRNSGVTIHEADSGKQAVDKALKLNPDLILMDINMESPYAGLDATKSIKSSLPETVVWAVTAQAMKGYDGEEGDEQKCINAGCDRFISKPYDQRELIYGIAQVLNIDVPENKKRLLDRDRDLGIDEY